MRCGVQHVRMVVYGCAIDSRAVGLELLLRGEQRSLGAAVCIARVLQLFAGNRTGSRQALPPSKVVLGSGEIGLAYFDRRLQLLWRRQTAAVFHLHLKTTGGADAAHRRRGEDQGESFLHLAELRG